MCHFGVNISSKPESFLCLNIISFRFIKFICIAVIDIYLFIYLFSYVIFVSLDQLIFYIKYA